VKQAMRRLVLGQLVFRQAHSLTVAQTGQSRQQTSSQSQGCWAVISLRSTLPSRQEGKCVRSFAEGSIVNKRPATLLPHHTSSHSDINIGWVIHLQVTQPQPRNFSILGILETSPAAIVVPRPGILKLNDATIAVPEE